MKLIDTEIDFPRLDVAIEAMKDSLEAIKNIYRDGFKITIKSDNSPVTDADLASDKILREKILSRFPEDGYLSEEEKDDMSRLEKNMSGLSILWMEQKISSIKMECSV